MKLLWLFIGLNIVNVIVQTIKSIATLKCGKVGASVINAVAYGFYTIVTIYMLCDLPLFWKAGIVALCNLIGVYVVKWGEEKARKDKLWKVEATIQNVVWFTGYIKEECEKHFIPYSIINVENVEYIVFNFYCATQEKSRIVKQICDRCNAKYFVSESKNL
jgi:hypothetical protein